jgi:hypothetical protein
MTHERRQPEVGFGPARCMVSDENTSTSPASSSQGTPVSAPS